MRFLFYIFFIVFNIFSVLSQNELMPRIIQIEKKYGLVDGEGNSILPPIYDTIYSSIPNYERISENVTWLAPVFIFKKNAKYNFAYYVSIDTISNFKILPEKERYWRIDELIYDSISEYSFGSDYYSDTTGGGFGRRPYYVFKFKSNNKWGMLYIRGVGTYLRHEFASPVNRPGRLGHLEVVDPIFDKIGGRIGYSLYEVKLNGQWTFLQVLYKPANYGANEKWNKDHTTFEWELAPLIWCDRTFKDRFDTIVPLGDRYNESKYFNVKKDKKWGAVKLDDKGELNYIIPCIYDSIAKEYTPMIAYTDTSTVLYDYDGNGKTVEVQLVKDKDYLEYSGSRKFKQYYIYFFLSHQKFLQCANYGTGEMKPHSSYNIVVIDSTTNRVVENYKSSEGVMYDRLRIDDKTSYLIRKVVQVEKGYMDYFIDLETKEVMFTLFRENEEKLGECYSIKEGYPTRENLSIIKYTKRNRGDMKKKVIGCYDFKTKKYTKGKCNE